MREPVLQAGLHRRCVQRLRRQCRPVAAGGHHHRAAAHQELVDREYRLVVQVRWIHHHQHVRSSWHRAIVQVRRFHIEINGYGIAQSLKLVAGRLLRLLAHVGGHGLRRRQGDSLQQTGGETLQALVEAASQAIAIKGLRQRQLHHRFVVRQREVEVEGIDVKQARRHRPEAVVGGELLCKCAAVRLRIEYFRAQLAVRFGDHLVEHGGQLRAQGAQRVRQAFVGGDIARELHRLAHAVEHGTAALEAVQHLLDGAGDVVLRILQTHVEIGFATHLDFNEIAEAEHFVFVAVLHQHVEIGIDQARLVSIRHLERHRADAVFGVGLVLQFRIVGWVDQFEPHLPAAGHFVFGEQILQLRHQRRQQRMGLGAEVAAQQERFAQLPQIAVGGLRDRVLIACGCVPAQKVDCREP